MIRPGSIIILDFGGQYAHLIGRRVRECGAYSEILPPATPAEDLRGAAGIILSGGPQSVYEKGSPQADRVILDLGIPVLGICYGHQWIAHVLQGTVQPGTTKEYGFAKLRLEEHGGMLLSDFPDDLSVWMSHGDAVTVLPQGFRRIASSENCENAAMEHPDRHIFGVQFHIEVTHTQQGSAILKHFVDLCHHAPWSVENFLTHIGAQVRRDVGDRNVFLLVSGGVDSTVTFALLEKELGQDRVFGLLVDTGLMRKDEVRQIQQALTALGFDNMHVEDASELFFERLHGVVDPEQKRQVIGTAFLDVQRHAAKELHLDGPKWMLGQGTIYPDTIETGGTMHADRIKTHHNRVEEIQRMMEEGRVVEPLKDLYKDEVRKLGELLGLPRALVWRHPFPGPGLGVRILCAKGESKTMHDEPIINIPHAVLPLRSVGVQGDGRTYRHALVLFSGDDVWPLATNIPNRDARFNRVLLCTSHVAPVPFVLTPMAITRERADLLREADVIVDQEIRRADLYARIWQFPVVLLPVGAKTGGQSIVLRPVESTEAMTANAFRLSGDVLQRLTERLMKLNTIDFVFYDLTSKPPATIEWE